MRRFAFLITGLLVMATLLDAKYFTEIRVGAFVTKLQAKTALNKLRDIISGDKTLHVLAHKWHFKSTYRMSGKYYVTVVKPFNTSPILTSVLHALQRYYKSSYPERIYNKTLIQPVLKATMKPKVHKRLPAVLQPTPTIEPIIHKNAPKKQETIKFLKMPTIISKKNSIIKQAKNAREVKHFKAQPTTHITLSKKKQLFKAIADNNITKLTKLLSEGVDVNAKNRYRQTPLIAAAPHGSLEVIKLLILHGANIHSRDFFHNTPLYNASATNSVKVIKFLISHGANIHAKNYNGSTAVFNAAFGGNLKVLKFLMLQGVNIHAKDDNGDTPLFWAASNGQLSVVKFLISQGAKIKLLNKYGATPPDLAQANNHQKVLSYLINHAN